MVLIQVMTLIVLSSIILLTLGIGITIGYIQETYETRYEYNFHGLYAMQIGKDWFKFKLQRLNVYQ